MWRASPLPSGSTPGRLNSKRWFWTERWQALEREADEDVAAGRVSRAADVDEFLETLERSRLE